MSKNTAALSASTTEDTALEFLATGKVTLEEFKTWKDSLILCAQFSTSHLADTPLEELRNFAGALATIKENLSAHGKKATSQNGGLKNYAEFKDGEVMVRFYL